MHETTAQCAGAPGAATSLGLGHSVTACVVTSRGAGASTREHRRTTMPPAPAGRWPARNRNCGPRSGRVVPAAMLIWLRPCSSQTAQRSTATVFRQDTNLRRSREVNGRLVAGRTGLPPLTRGRCHPAEAPFARLVGVEVQLGRILIASTCRPATFGGQLARSRQHLVRRHYGVGQKRPNGSSGCGLSPASGHTTSAAAAWHQSHPHRQAVAKSPRPSQSWRDHTYAKPPGHRSEHTRLGKSRTRVTAVARREGRILHQASAILNAWAAGMMLKNKRRPNVIYTFDIMPTIDPSVTKVQTGLHLISVWQQARPSARADPYPDRPPVAASCVRSMRHRRGRLGPPAAVRLRRRPRIPPVLAFLAPAPACRCRATARSGGRIPPDWRQARHRGGGSRRRAKVAHFGWSSASGRSMAAVSAPACTARMP